MIQRRVYKAGLSKQSAKGSIAGAATYAFGASQGSVFKVEPTENELGLTWSNLGIWGFDRSALKPSMDLTTIATPALTGLALLGVLGTDVVTGAGPYTHTETPAPLDYPYMTAWGTLGGADWTQIGDCKINSVEFSWENAGRVNMKLNVLGCTPAMLGAAYTETNQELLTTVGNLAAGGGLFKVEGVPARVHGGTVKIDSHIDQVVVSTGVAPVDVVPGKREITWSLKIVPDDTGLFREVVFGSNAPGALSTVSQVPRVGSVETKFIGPSGSSLDLLSTAVKFLVGFPEGSPEGGPAEFTLAGVSQLPASGLELTATMINSIATY